LTNDDFTPISRILHRNNTGGVNHCGKDHPFFATMIVNIRIGPDARGASHVSNESISEENALPGLTVFSEAPLGVDDDVSQTLS
jgi:hypothetical protein